MTARIIHFTPAIWQHIFEFDPTFKDIYKNEVVKELKWSNLWKSIPLNKIRSIFVLNMSRVPYMEKSYRIMQRIMEKEMKTVVPILEHIGFEPDTFGKSEWYFDNKEGLHKRYDRLAICLNLKIDHINPRLKKWGEDELQRICEERVKSTNEQIEDVINGLYAYNRVFGKGNPIKYLSSTILKNSKYVIETTTNMRGLCIEIYTDLYDTDEFKYLFSFYR